MKIGRNDPCPCGSGIKYKKCCHGKAQFQPAPAEQQQAITLSTEIEKVQAAAVAKEKYIKNLGVFVFFATEQGDGWLLEISEMDAVQVATNGEKIDIDLDENPETIEINWSHRFSVKNKQFTTVAYRDDAKQVWENYPTHSIFAAIQRVRKKFPKELLSSIHIDEDQGTIAQAAE
ncbi:MAG: SEC-C domain-containing protein [Desulfobulbaceae bacterium]|uniref:SEC-C domain-containing protein n=1 Tax=Candidatus Desulfobia pelagia TaxID=2841692 RepID=A0A8J6NBH6_9BACT|nr:SEC-C domain-containing protein [Candidatus Desulfobia pelagia]